MSNISLTISKRYRYFFYCVLGLSLVTGVAFWVFRRFFMVEGDFGPESHFLQYPMLQIHGFSAFVMMMSLGAIFASHIPKTWSSKRARKSGLFILIATSLSIVSAYILYYLVSEDWHEWLGNGHAIVGILLPAILLLHIKKARISRYKRKTKDVQKRVRRQSHVKSQSDA
ncbi:hypothetical protein [Pseudocolwellia agarivorans]|jgi:MFS family permease|uniref:hypothetical protein n=1 Tax=Pseudocolwellia agarivorans TaxID=1911682 RepID=UPI003F88115A